MYCVLALLIMLLCHSRKCKPSVSVGWPFIIIFFLYQKEPNELAETVKQKGLVILRAKLGHAVLNRKVILH